MINEILERTRQRVFDTPTALETLLVILADETNYEADKNELEEIKAAAIFYTLQIEKKFSPVEVTVRPSIPDITTTIIRWRQDELEISDPTRTAAMALVNSQLTKYFHQESNDFDRAIDRLKELLGIEHLSPADLSD